MSEVHRSKTGSFAGEEERIEDLLTFATHGTLDVAITGASTEIEFTLDEIGDLPLGDFSTEQRDNNYALLLVGDELFSLSSQVSESTRTFSYNFTRATAGTTAIDHALSADCYFFFLPKIQTFSMPPSGANYLAADFYYYHRLVPVSSLEIGTAGSSITIQGADISPPPPTGIDATISGPIANIEWDYDYDHPIYKGVEIAMCQDANDPDTTAFSVIYGGINKGGKANFYARGVYDSAYFYLRRVSDYSLKSAWAYLGIFKYLRWDKENSRSMYLTDYEYVGGNTVQVLGSGKKLYFSYKTADGSYPMTAEFTAKHNCFSPANYLFYKIHWRQSDGTLIASYTVGSDYNRVNYFYRRNIEPKYVSGIYWNLSDASDHDDCYVEFEITTQEASHNSAFYQGEIHILMPS